MMATKYEYFWLRMSINRDISRKNVWLLLDKIVFIGIRDLDDDQQKRQIPAVFGRFNSDLDLDDDRNNRPFSYDESEF